MKPYIYKATLDALKEWSSSNPNDLQKICKYLKDICAIRTKSDNDKVKMSDKYKASSLGQGLPAKYKKPNGKKYTGEEFCREVAIKSRRYVANIGGHHVVAIVDKKVHDIWDSTDGCIGNYWVKY